MSNALIVIPARMGSTRFPGKPLAEISGVSMVRRTAKIAASIPGADYIIATDHHEIESHCKSFSLPVVMTDSSLRSGSDRTLAAANIVNPECEILVNLQGDAPFTDPEHIQLILERLASSEVEIATPAIQLDWDSLDRLRHAKEITPFSGTTVIENDGRAIWFSKNIIPVIRNEAKLRTVQALSPVLRHIGLYGFRRTALEKFTALRPSRYETLEGLEQLRALENGLHIALVKVAPPKISSPGIDTPEDLARAEELIRDFGDPFIS